MIAGPTAVGKTSLCIDLAREIKTEIVSADARQFYRELQIGSASPTKEERQQIPHHLIGHLSIRDYYNVAIYETQALEIINNLFRLKDYVILTGGSGLYLDTIYGGIDDLPDPDPAQRQKVKQIFANEGITGLRNWLRKIDPSFYNEVDRANPKRMMRALEVYFSSGQPFSTLRKKQPQHRPFRIKRVIINRPRVELFQRINNRTDEMIRRGLIEEAIGMYPMRHHNALNTLGYKELFDWLANRWNLELAIEKIKTNTRRYAKRQLTWFKRYDDATWFHPEDRSGILNHILQR